MPRTAGPLLPCALSAGTVTVVPLTDDGATLSNYAPNLMTLHVTDTNSDIAAGELEDVSQVAKVTISDNAYRCSPPTMVLGVWPAPTFTLSCASPLGPQRSTKTQMQLGGQGHRGHTHC